MKYIAYAIWLVLFAACAPRADAARLVLEADRSSFENGGGGEVRVLLDPEGQVVTALSGRVVLSGNFAFSRIADGGSVVSSWIDGPRVDGSSAVFSGIIPGGFRGSYTPFSEGTKPGLVLAADIVASGRTGSVFLADLIAYGGDDGSEQIPLRSEPLVFENMTPSVSGIAATADTQAPTDVTVDIVEFPDGAGWFAVFSAVDSGRGIDHFEVQESSSPQTFASAWKRAESPYRLSDQGRSRYIFVRAVDRAGNASIAYALPAQASPFPWYIPALVIAVFGIVYIVYRRRKV